MERSETKGTPEERRGERGKNGKSSNRKSALIERSEIKGTPGERRGRKEEMENHRTDRV